MPWRAECYECGREAGITKPIFATLSSFLTAEDPDSVEMAEAYYEPHPSGSADARPCTGAGKVVPRAKMRAAYNTAPGEDPPTLDPRGVRR